MSKNTPKEINSVTLMDSFKEQAAFMGVENIRGSAKWHIGTDDKLFAHFEGKTKTPVVSPIDGLSGDNDEWQPVASPYVTEETVTEDGMAFSRPQLEKIRVELYNRMVDIDNQLVKEGSVIKPFGYKDAQKILGYIGETLQDTPETATFEA